jgi:signal transduction histidine kinase
LFQDFVRIKNEKTKAISGSGLGLSIMKKIVEEVYSGSVSVESKEDVGSTFTVVLPKINIAL